MSARRHLVPGYHPERACGKWRYPSRHLAEQSRERFEKEGEVWAVYGCPGCGGFHLTSQPNRDGSRRRG